MNQIVDWYSCARPSARATVEIPGGERRLKRIVQLIRSCRYSFHDLLRVELDLRQPAASRFNMPLDRDGRCRGFEAAHIVRFQIGTAEYAKVTERPWR